MAIISACFSFLALNLARFGFRNYDEHIVNYKEDSKIDYKVYLKPNDFFAEDFLPQGMSYVTSLIDFLRLDFNYNLDLDEKVSGNYSYYIKGTVTANRENSDSKFYTKDYILKDVKTESYTDKENINIKDSIDVDYDIYNNVLTSFRDEYGVQMDGNLKVSLIVENNVKNSVSGESVSLKNETDTYLQSSGADTANIYQQYETTLSLVWWAGARALPDTVTITMGGRSLVSGSDYTYDSSSGKIIINKVDGDIRIQAESKSTSCFVEGTKIRLADGGYKNVEDIDYDDLLMVYDHENGGVTYEYPIWIEKGKKASVYQKTTFSDGSYLNTYGLHSVFSYDKMNFVNVLDKDNFHVGTRIVKIDEFGRQKIVKVTKIEQIHEDINYYHVSSTRYHNVLANDVLTTDGTGVTTYLYSFKDDLTWGSDRDEFLAKGDIFTYEFLKPIFPKYLYYGYRMAEGKNPYNKGLLDIGYIAELLDVSNTKEIMKDDDGHTLWMVTTSDDVVTPFNKRKFLRREDSYYKLPKPLHKKDFIGWLNTGDNKIYKPGDKVQVLYGTHFIAKYE